MINLIVWRSAKRQEAFDRVGWACPKVPRHFGVAAGLLFNKHAWWVGLHYSPTQKRYCLNLVPCFTLWYCVKGGLEP